MSSTMRQRIRKEVSRISPLDNIELASQRDVLSWIDSGVEICRLEKPAVPPKHLVSYFALVDGEYVLLVDHINAGLWLPTGGHVEPDEHPRETAVREAQEELSTRAQFLHDGPLFLSVSQTVGRTAGHTDVSIWYTLKGDRSADLDFDRSEFRSIRWFHKNEIPLDQTDPHMARFLAKLFPG